MLEAFGLQIAGERRTVLVQAVSDLRRRKPAAPSSRRMDRPGSRDNLVMRFGQAVELKGALGMSDVVFVGANFAGRTILGWNQQAAEEILRRDPDGCVDPINLLLEIVRDPAKRQYLSELGEFVRYRAGYQKYNDDVLSFEDGAPGRSPNAAWRGKKPTDAQIYIVNQIQRLLTGGDPGSALPPLQTRGEAHDFIARNGGNPRFHVEPRPPSIPKIAAGDTAQSQLELEK